ncbi:MAG: hypothetical protein OXD44_01930 [Gammaproteobacteria bacterium]|nr:hypothetical protein [Gammaproteobacteria bacterium]
MKIRSLFRLKCNRFAVADESLAADVKPMRPVSDSERLAVLINADNVGCKYADDIFREAAKIGKTNIKRIYGDFSISHLNV